MTTTAAALKKKMMMMMMLLLMQELQQVRDGSYMSDLYKIVEFGSGHVVKCERCSACGFICEVCNDDSDVIYPFDVTNTVTVRTCHSFTVFYGSSS